MRKPSGTTASDDNSKQFLNKIVEVGTVSLVAKSAINALKMIPGVNLGAAALNSVIAGGIMATLGEGSVYAFEQVYLGNKTIEDLDWVGKVMESRLSNDFVAKLSTAITGFDGKITTQKMVETIVDLFVGKKEGAN